MKLALAGVLVAAMVADAGANGRPAGTSTIHFRKGHEVDIAAGLTFGLIVSHDGGTTWQWECEASVGYGGLYDPDYVYTATGGLFATTFAGLKIARGDLCTFAATSPGMTFISQAELGPDDALYIAAADKNDAKIYKSTDDGMSFGASTNPGQADDWWQSLIVAPGDPLQVFLAGYRYTMVCDANSVTPGMACTDNPGCEDGTHQSGMCVSQKVLLAFKSVNGGGSFTPLPGNLAKNGAAPSAAAGFTTSRNSTLDFVGVSNDGTTLYARISQQSATMPSDGLYKINTTTGTSWTPLLTVADTMAVLLRPSNGDLLVGTRTQGLQVSVAGGAFTPIANAPHINCLSENPADHSVWACTQNYGAPGVPSDGFGIMKAATNYATWTGVLKYEDIQAPVACDPGTIQHDMCEAVNWCGLKQQLGITSSVVDCASPVDGIVDGGTGMPKKKDGCCDAGTGGETTALVSGTMVGAVLLRRRRRKL